ncbi:MAG: MCP four helix bundle domain-containing protein [Defluviitaleaceae bacterium]|nr:MCP four helix bundle domain-containing protein [Defluviitaleaceae bacterium]
MKGKKVSTKLTMSFFIVIALTVLVGLAGVVGMVQINRGSMEMYESQSQPLADLGMAREYFQRLRVQLRDIVLASGDTYALALIEADLIGQERGFLENMESYRQTINDPSIIELYDDIMSIFAAYQPSMQQIIASARVHAPPVQMILMMDDLVVPTDFIMEALDYLAYARVRQAAHANEVNRMLFNVLFIMIITVIVLALVLGIFVTKNVSVLSKMEFNRLADENAALESLSHMKTEFLQDIKHEIRNPLQVISLGTDFVAGCISNPEREPDAKNALTAVQHEAMRLGHMVNGMVELATMSGNINRKKTDLAAMLKNCAETSRLLLKQKNIALHIDAAPSLPHVYVEAEQMVRVPINLINNATNAIGHGQDGKIVITATADEGYVTVRMRDTGEGIPSGLLPKVFERGISGKGSKGFGLSICKTIIEAHGGTIGIESEKGSGTAVTFTIPVYGGQSE